MGGDGDKLNHCRVEFGMAMSISFSHNGDVWNCVIWLFLDNHKT